MAASTETLLVDLHVKYIQSLDTRKDDLEYWLTEHLRLNGVYWGLTALDLMHHIDALDREEVIAYVKGCQHSNGGFGGHTGHDPHMIYTLSAVQILITEDAIAEIDTQQVVDYVLSLQNEDGSFRGDEWGEVDTRFVYMALSTLSLLNRLDAIDLDKPVAWLRKCQNYDGGFGSVPGAESHAGQSFVDPYMIIYSGTTDTSSSSTSTDLVGSTDLYVWNVNGTWMQPNQIFPANTTAISPQIFAGGTVVPSNPGSLYILQSNNSVGGSVAVLQTSDWAWNFPTSQLTPPPLVLGAAFTAVSNNMYVFGGNAATAKGQAVANNMLNNGYTFNTNNDAWNGLPNGPAVGFQPMCFVSSCNCIIMFGGATATDPTTNSGNIALLDLQTNTWNLQYPAQPSNNSVPAARRLHTSVCTSDKMIMFGGGTNTPIDSNVWVLDASKWPTLSWIKQSTTGQGPNGRMGHSAVVSNDGQMYIFGGWGPGVTGDNNVFSLNTTSWQWAQIGPTSNNSASSSASSPAGQSTPSQSLSATGSGSKANTAAIAGGVVGAFVAGLIVGVGFWLFRRRQSRRKIPDPNKQYVTSGQWDEDDDNDWGTQVVLSGSAQTPERSASRYSAGMTTLSHTNSVDGNRSSNYRLSQYGNATSHPSTPVTDHFWCLSYPRSVDGDSSAASVNRRTVDFDAEMMFHNVANGGNVGYSKPFEMQSDKPHAKDIGDDPVGSQATTISRHRLTLHSRDNSEDIDETLVNPSPDASEAEEKNSSA
ncbi:hypothetical protein BZG36_04084 [Bifiguratus adelaidae]|uniref:protein geranylgeranyltransferase type II n=1 Tax=Bifiguratus adelaidae TaxID=1938954 RepID=A0A261XWY7_9FUNG|nr:hypothetical protein BZG36_04084 [Bifiguratus adelaidae]